MTVVLGFLHDLGLPRGDLNELPDVSATARVHAGFVAAAHGMEQVVANLEDCVRAAAHGFRSVLIADVGVLSLFGEARRTGLLPADLQAKVSVMLPAANPAGARVFEAPAVGLI